MSSGNAGDQGPGGPQYGQQPPQYGQQPPQYGQQPPQYGQQPPQYGQQPPQYGQQPAYGGYPQAPGAPMDAYGYPGPPAGPGRPAGMGARFGGLLLDALIIGIPTAILGLFLGAYHHTRTCSAGGSCASSVSLNTTWSIDLIGLALGIAYSAYFVGTRTQTIGHRAAGIRVIDADSGAPIGAGRGALRWLVMTLTGAICTIGYWSPFFDGPRRRGWHDKATNSMAVTAR